MAVRALIPLYTECRAGHASTLLLSRRLRSHVSRGWTPGAGLHRGTRARRQAWPLTTCLLALQRAELSIIWLFCLMIKIYLAVFTVQTSRSVAITCPFSALLMCRSWMFTCLGFVFYKAVSTQQHGNGSSEMKPFYRPDSSRNVKKDALGGGDMMSIWAPNQTGLTKWTRCRNGVITLCKYSSVRPRPH